jgi:hypothetical protein
MRFDTDRARWRLADRVAQRAARDIDRALLPSDYGPAVLDDALEKVVIRLFEYFALGERDARAALRKAQAAHTTTTPTP